MSAIVMNLKINEHFTAEYLKTAAPAKPAERGKPRAAKPARQRRRHPRIGNADQLPRLHGMTWFW
jgi:hypothetical protein